MKLSDYVIQFLAEKRVTHFFGMSGGAAVHLFDSIAKNPATNYICVQHEQSAATAADGYARTTGKLGVAVTTSGPGATNLITGVCSSYYDSIPTLMLTGQVATHRLKGNLKVRQIGFQETDVISIYQTITKYAYQLQDPHSIRYHLEKAYYLAFEGRPGPVLLDIPDDLQRCEVNPASIRSFSAEPIFVEKNFSCSTAIKELLEELAQAKRPILVLGAGLKTPPIPQKEIIEFVEKLNIPVLLTWGAIDLLPALHPLRVGPFGVYGPRPGNFAIQNSDYILCIGSRLSQNLTGGILNSFAREATITMVDVDEAEMEKFEGRGIHIARKIVSSAQDFIRNITNNDQCLCMKKHSGWLEKIADWKKLFSLSTMSPKPEHLPCIDAYEFIEKLTKIVSDNELIFVDTGGNLTWTCNGWKPKKNQKIHSAWNNTPMGYSLPAAIGASFGNRSTPITCIIGDGGLMICLSELSTIVYHKLPIRIFLFNNHGHGIQKQTLETWLEGRYAGVHPESGLAFPNFVAIAKAFNLPTITINKKELVKQQLREIYESPGPIFINVEINPDQKLYPVLKFGASLENQLPSIEASIIQREMIIKSSSYPR